MALEWQEQRYRNPEQVAYRSGPFVIYAGPGGIGPCVLSSGPPWFHGPFHFADVCLAKERAECLADLGEG